MGCGGGLPLVVVGIEPKNLPQVACSFREFLSHHQKFLHIVVLMADYAGIHEVFRGNDPVVE